MNFNDIQLKFDLEGFDELDDQEGGAISPEDARRISEAARITLESETIRDETEVEAWFPDYLKLIDMGWPWRVASYIAWASSPKASRWPRTITELATEILGLTSPRTIYHWRRKYPTIDAVVAVIQAAPLMAHRRDVIDALIEVARTADYKGFNDRKLFLELTGDYIPKSEIKARLGRVKDLSELSDEELDLLMGEDEGEGE